MSLHFVQTLTMFTVYIHLLARSAEKSCPGIPERKRYVKPAIHIFRVKITFLILFFFSTKKIHPQFHSIDCTYIILGSMAKMRFIEPKTNFPRGRRSQADIIENHIWSFEMTVLWFAQKSKEWFNVAFMTHGLKAKLIIDIVYTVDNWYCYMFEVLSNSKHIVFIYETHWINVHTYKQVFFS